MGFLVPAEADASYTDQAELDPYDLLIIAAGHIGTGVRTGCAVTQQGTTDDTVAVSAGTYDIAWAPLNQAGGNVNVLSGATNADGTEPEAADANYFRYDFIVQNTSGQLGVLHGTVPNPVWPSYSVNPKFPAVDFTVHCVLGAVLVPPTAASISGVATSQIVTKDLTHKYPSFANITGTAATAQIADDAVTYAKMQNTAAASKVLGRGSASGAGDLEEITLGTGLSMSGTTLSSSATLTTLLGTDTLWAAKGDIVVATADNTAAVLTAPTQRKQVLGADAVGNVAWQPMQSGPTGVRTSDDMFYAANVAVATWVSGHTMGPLSTTLVGTVSAITANGTSVTSTANHPGVVALTTGTTTTGRAALYGTSFILGGGRTRWGAWVAVPVVSDGTDRFGFCAGFLDAFTSATVVDGLYFNYTDNVASGAWTANASSNSVKTATDAVTTGVTATAGQWFFLEIEVNAAGTSATFYVDKVLTNTFTTNIPTGAGRETQIMMSNVKSLGTTSRGVNLDAWYYENDFTTAR